MKKLVCIKLIIIVLITLTGNAWGQANSGEMRIAPAPLFQCPVTDGAACPRVIWNPLEKAWFMFYQPRNKNAVLKEDKALSFCFGTDIGIASSKDNGQTWLYRGIAEGLEFEPGRNSWSFPEVEYLDGVFHLWCQYDVGWPADFHHTSQIVHYTSKDLWHWEYDKMVKEDDHRKNSMEVYRLPNGKWRMYYNDNTVLNMMESDNLYDWKYIGKSVDDLHNSTNVFKLGGWYWMTIDTYDGFSIWKSKDCLDWEHQNYKIFSGDGVRTGDGSHSHHSGVVEMKDKVYMFYYCHSERTSESGILDKIHGEPHLRRSVIQVAQITEKDGRLIGTRNEPFDFYLPDQD